MGNISASCIRVIPSRSALRVLFGHQAARTTLSPPFTTLSQARERINVARSGLITVRTRRRSRGTPLCRAVEHRERPGRERHPVLATSTHVLGRERPHRPVPVDLLPPGVSHLARTRAGEHQEFEREHGAEIGAGALHGRERRAELRVGRAACALWLWAARGDLGFYIAVNTPERHRRQSQPCAQPGRGTVSGSGRDSVYHRRTVTPTSTRRTAGRWPWDVHG